MAQRLRESKSVFEKWFAGSTGNPPVPSGDSPDETGATVRGNEHVLFATLLAAIPVGESPTGAGGSPAPPIFKTGSNGADSRVSPLTADWERGTKRDTRSVQCVIR